MNLLIITVMMLLNSKLSWAYTSQEIAAMQTRFYIYFPQYSKLDEHKKNDAWLEHIRKYSPDIYKIEEKRIAAVKMEKNRLAKIKTAKAKVSQESKKIRVHSILKSEKFSNPKIVIHSTPPGSKPLRVIENFENRNFDKKLLFSAQIPEANLPLGSESYISFLIKMKSKWKNWPNEFEKFIANPEYVPNLSSEEFLALKNELRYYQILESELTLFNLVQHQRKLIQVAKGEKVTGPDVFQKELGKIKSGMLNPCDFPYCVGHSSDKHECQNQENLCALPACMGHEDEDDSCRVVSCHGREKNIVDYLDVIKLVTHPIEHWNSHIPCQGHGGYNDVCSRGNIPVSLLVSALPYVGFVAGSLVYYYGPQYAEGHPLSCSCPDVHCVANRHEEKNYQQQILGHIAKIKKTCHGTFDDASEKLQIAVNQDSRNLENSKIDHAQNIPASRSSGIK